MLLWLRLNSFFLKNVAVTNELEGYPSRSLTTATFFKKNEFNLSHSNIFKATVEIRKLKCGAGRGVLRASLLYSY